MKQLLKVGFTDAIQSFCPILLWIEMAVLFNNSIYSEGFMITYPLQFVSMLLYVVIVKGQLKREVRDKDTRHDRACSGLIVLFIVYLVLFAGSYIYKSDILHFFGFELNYSEIFLFGTGHMFLDWILYGVVNIKQYSSDNASAFKIACSWYVGKLVVCFVAWFVFRNFFSVFLVSLISYTIIAFLLTLNICICSKMKFKFSIVDGFKFSTFSIPQSLCMFIIYVYGVNFMQTQTTVMLAAYNMMSMCTDVQWDILSSAPDTIGSLECGKGTFLENRKKLFINSVLYSLLLFMSSLVLLVILSFVPVYRESVDFHAAFICFILECFMFPIYAIKYMMYSYLQIMHPSMIGFGIIIISHIFRFSTMIISNSDYKVALGVVSSALVGNTLSILYYLYCRHNENKVCMEVSNV